VKKTVSVFGKIRKDLVMRSKLAQKAALFCASLLQEHPEIFTKEVFEKLDDLLTSRREKWLRDSANLLMIPNDLRTNRFFVESLVSRLRKILKNKLYLDRHGIVPGSRVFIHNWLLDEDSPVRTVENVTADFKLMFVGVRGAFCPTGHQVEPAP
jgi:hypothetical protein